MNARPVAVAPPRPPPRPDADRREPLAAYLRRDAESRMYFVGRFRPCRVARAAAKYSLRRTFVPSVARDFEAKLRVGAVASAFGRVREAPCN
jgi:hypothetical protein